MLELQINGQARTLELDAPTTMHAVLAALELKADRVAVEQNGAIVGRARWESTAVQGGDRLEIVHFVGGGSSGERVIWFGGAGFRRER